MPSKNSIAVVFDDHKIYAESFSSLIEHYAIFNSVFTYIDESELIRFCINHSSKRQIYLFLDFYLKDKVAFSIINEVRRIIKGVKIVIVSSITDPVSIQNILNYHPEGFLSKSGGFSEVLECIQMLGEDVQYLSPIIQNYVQDVSEKTVNPFSSREIEMLEYFNQGYSISLTAEKAFLSKHTIVSHRRRMMEKAGCKSIGELLAFSRKRGLI